MSMDPEQQIQQEDSEDDETPEWREYRLEQERKEEVRYIWWQKYKAACAVEDTVTIEEIWRSGQFQSFTYMLSKSIRQGSLVVTRFIFEKLGADIKDELLITLLEECRSLDMFKLLAELGLDFKSKGNAIMGCMLDDRDILDWFLEQGTDINGSRHRHLWVLKTKTCDVLDEAAVRGDIEMFDYLVSRGADPSRSFALHTATWCKDPVKTTSMMTHLIEKYHFDVNSDDRCHPFLEKSFGAQFHDGPPLNYAISCRNIPAIRVLLKYKANLSIGKSLTVAFQSVHGPHGRMDKSEDLIPMLELLLEAGADASYGLHNMALDYEDLAAAKLCLEYGADPIEAERRDAWLVGRHADYNGMSIEMRNLINEWKPTPNPFRGIEIHDLTHEKESNRTS